jgi:hypothetical protein
MRIAFPVIMAMLAGAGQAQAEGPLNPALRDRFFFGIGAYFPNTTTQAQLDSNTLGVGVNVDFERALGMDDSRTVPSAFGRWRLGERWRIEAEYFQINRSSTRVIDREIRWGDRVFPINAEVSSSFDFYDLRVSAGYSIFKRPDKEIGVGLGVHVAAYDASLSATAVGTQQEDVLAPLPVISVYGQFALTERWAVGGRLDRFSLEYDDYDGHLTSLGLDLTYQPFKHVGFGIGYRDLFIRMTATGDRRTLHFRQSFEGPLVFMNVSF